MLHFKVSGNAGRLPAAGLHAVGGASDAQDADDDDDAASVVGLARSGAESSRLKGETQIVTVASSGSCRSSQLNTHIFHSNQDFIRLKPNTLRRCAFSLGMNLI